MFLSIQNRIASACGAPFLLNGVQHFGPMAAVFVLWLMTAVTANSGELVYGAVGDTVILMPGLVTGPIGTVMWKHNADIAMQWDGEETHSFSQFEARGMLTKSTGALMIKGLTRNDSGSYTAEANDKVISTTQLLVISPVSKPSISTSCDPAMTYCVFTCEGNTTDADPIIFMWMASNAAWNSTNVYNITKDVTEPWFRCELMNPVSRSTSDAVPNPFTSRNRIFMCTCLIVLAAVTALVCVLCFRYRRGNGENVNGTADEQSAMFVNGRGAASQDLTHVVSEGTTNGTAVMPAGQDAPDQELQAD